MGATILHLCDENKEVNRKKTVLQKYSKVVNGQYSIVPDEVMLGFRKS